MKTIRWMAPGRFGRGAGVAAIALTALFGSAGCTEVPSDDMVALVQYLPLAVVVPRGQELQRAEEYAAAHPGHFAYLAVMSRPLSPYGGKAGLVAKDLAWSELERGMTVVYVAGRDGAVAGFGAGLLVERMAEGWTIKSWGFDAIKPTLLKPSSYAGVIVVAFVGEDPAFHDPGILTGNSTGGRPVVPLALTFRTAAQGRNQSSSRRPRASPRPAGQGPGFRAAPNSNYQFSILNFQSGSATTLSRINAAAHSATGIENW